MINIFKENYINKLLTHTLILLISFLISYLIFSSTSSKSLKITKAFLVVHAQCNVLHYGSDLLALMDKFRKKSILINHKHNVQCEDFTLYNSKTWWMPVQDNSVIFFPSNLSHEVMKNKTDRTRVSLAFNCFIKGTFGSIPNLKRLNL